MLAYQFKTMDKIGISQYTISFRASFHWFRWTNSLRPLKNNFTTGKCQNSFSFEFVFFNMQNQAKAEQSGFYEVGQTPAQGTVKLGE